ncbi:hypothetical protein pb186bvf_013830 [Paramecium bursaria]
MEQYQQAETIGQGTFGKVVRALKDGKEYAIKILKKSQMTTEKDIQRYKQETEILRILDHPNIIRSYELHQDEENHYIIMEYVDGTDLYSFIDKNRRYLKISNYQITGRLNYLHKNGIIHRDLKPENIMLQELDVKLIDFGLGVSENNMMELRRIFGVQVVFCMLCYKINKSCAKRLLTQILEFLELQGIIEKDVSKRFSIEDIYNSTFFDKYQYVAPTHLIQELDQMESDEELLDGIDDQNFEQSRRESKISSKRKSLVSDERSIRDDQSVRTKKSPQLSEIVKKSPIEEETQRSLQSTKKARQIKALTLGIKTYRAAFNIIFENSNRFTSKPLVQEPQCQLSQKPSMPIREHHPSRPPKYQKYQI